MQIILLRLAPYIACLLIGLVSAYKVTADHYRAVIAKNDLAAVQSLAHAQEKVIVAVKQQQEITNQTAVDYETRISEIRKKYADDIGGIVASGADSVRLDKPANASGVRSVSNAASKSNDASACYRLSAQLRQAAELQTQQLISLQDWIRGQQTADKSATK